MATQWKSLSAEQKDAIRKRRKELYASKVSESKKQWFMVNQDGSTTQVMNKDMNNHLDHTATKVRRHQTAFNKRLEEIQKWRDEGGLFPWPNLKKKMEVTRLWVRIAHTLGRKCSECGTIEVFDFSWRLTRKDDFLAFVPFQKEAYEKVLAAPEQYELFCIKCCFDLRIFTFSWIFSPYSPRNGGHVDIVGDTYRSWPRRWLEMYPAEPELTKRIREGRIKSLTCGMRGPDGNFLPTFVRKSTWHSHVGVTPRDLAFHVMAQAGEYYSRLNPSVSVRNWGLGSETDARLTESKSGYDALGEDLKRFLREDAERCLSNLSKVSNESTEVLLSS